MKTEYHKVVLDILTLLRQGEYWFETFEHEPVRTSEEAAKIRGDYSLKQGAKTIIVRVKKAEGEKEFVMLVLPGNKRFDNFKVKKILGAKDIRFASEEEVSDLTDGVKVGGVPPFGNLFNMKAVVDETLFKNEKIVFNAGDRSFSIAMKSKDYRELAKPAVSSIIEK
ncbi:unnamed protein product [marine sediment metagenome]|uniref:YbaK/aminoacyl-tRNA synthetase-associated domain-containing protein n=1 Tax=marine sediment metagenome TaxID=412755 RepID=X0W1A1_9ZZZZ